MKKEQKKDFLLFFILIKRYQLSLKNIDVSINEIILFLNKLYFKDGFKKNDLKKLIKENCEQKLVDFLWTEAIVNPDGKNTKK